MGCLFVLSAQCSVLSAQECSKVAVISAIEAITRTEDVSLEPEPARSLAQLGQWPVASAHSAHARVHSAARALGLRAGGRRGRVGPLAAHVRGDARLAGGVRGARARQRQPVRRRQRRQHVPPLRVHSGALALGPLSPASCLLLHYCFPFCSRNSPNLL